MRTTAPELAAAPAPADPAPRWVAILGITITSLLVLAVLQPQLLVVANTPSGGDMGAHVLGPAYLRDVLLPEGRVLGWSNSWFAGFPIFYFYFPLPSLVIVALDLLLPYGVAFKVVTVIGLLAMAPATYFFARSMRFSRTAATVAAAAGGAFVFMESYTIYGGNIASTLAGEFSYSWSFALSLVYLGLLVRAIKDDRRFLPWAAAALAATALCHVLTTLVVIIASIPVLLWKRGTGRAVTVWIWGFLIAAFWALPLIMRIGLTSDMAWTPLSRWSDLFPVDAWLVIPLAVVGIVWSLRRTARVVPAVLATLIPLVYFWVPVVLPDLVPGLGDRWKLWNGRLLPYWFFGLYLFAGLAVGLAGDALLRRLPERMSVWWTRALLLAGGVVTFAVAAASEALPPWARWAMAAPFGLALIGSFAFPPRVSVRPVLTISVVVLLIGGGLAGVSFVNGWARWNYSGYEAKEGWPEYEQLMQVMDGLPSGRVQWEANGDLERYGTPMSPMLFPYWTEWTHPSMEGLFFESSITTPFHFLNHAEMSYKPSNPIPGLNYHTFDFERGVEHLGVYGVRYYVSFTEEAAAEAEQTEGLTLVAETAPFKIFELAPPSLVDVATSVPSVYEEPDGGVLSALGTEADTAPTFEEFALDWYDDIEGMDRWVVAEGPAEWPRITTLGERADTPIAGGGEVSDVVIDDERISFRTTAVGVPHLVKVSYFPNWTAQGAEGPWRAAPSLMVVVPTEEEVVLEFRNTWVETSGLVLSAVGIAGLAAWGLAWRRRRAAR